MRKYIRDWARNYLVGLFGKADITIDGGRPWDIQVLEPRFYETVVLGGSLALGEAYMNGWWECKALDQFFFRLLRNNIDRSICKILPELCKRTQAVIFNRQSRSRAYEVGEHHYDVGNDLFELMLDSYMTYSCGYWRDADNLDEAQRAKLDLICRKLDLQPGMRLLDIGCGWGSLALFAAQHYGVEVTGLTVSEEQLKFAQQRCKGLPVDVRLQDYRNVNGRYDAIASVGMFEHVGYKNYRTFMNVVRQLLEEDGLFLLHSIGSNETVHTCDPWFDRYIFPNGMLPSIKQLGTAIERNFVMEDWQNFGVDYERTLLCWHSNFERHWNKLKASYSETFYRMWKYYLLSIAGGFRARYIQVWQIVLSPKGCVQGYKSLRCPEC